jgi:microcompartment protein CcmK/EutM
MDPISHVALEQFVKYVPPDRVDSMMKVREFTGYLWAQIENWALDRKRALIIECISKGDTSKEKAAMIAKGSGFAGASEHEIDAFHQGLLARYDR